MDMTPYLSFDGQCRNAFEFYAECLDGEIEAMMTFGETPMAEHVPADFHDKIVHASLAFGDNVLMASDSMPNQYEEPKGTYVALHVKKAKKAEKLFHALAEGGTVVMPIEETFWAERFGMLVDRFGTPWMINCSKES